MKRVISLLLAFVLVLGAAVCSVQSVSAESEMTVSDELVKVLKLEEGFVRYPVWDYAQFSIGYGTRCPDDMLEYYRENGITESEAELLLRNHLTNTEKVVNTKLIDKYGLSLSQNQFDAIVSFCYNMGTAWISNPSQNIHKQIVSGATGNALIDAFSRWCNAGGVVQDFLIRRRLSEANMYLNGAYSRSIPSTYCYVTYNANGGSVSQSVQGFDSALAATPSATATNGSYTFLGWYTAMTGGTKVESLTAQHNKMTLYAHWKELENVDPGESMDPITVKVTTNDLRLRNGPGTNYGIIGYADTGDTFVITQVQKNGGYTWGKYDGGWICLQYTNYDSVISGSQEPEPTVPPTTEAPTNPPTTEPSTTVPPTTEAPKPAAVTGTVNANPYLCVRKGPGTGYATVDTLQSGEKVTITEQKTVGSMIWGKISAGWISMSYVTLDQSTSDSGYGSTSASAQSGTVTCGVLNVRSGAGIHYGISGYYYKGDTVSVTEQKTVGSTVWGKTAKGWVSMDYIKLAASGSTSNGVTGSTGSTGSAASAQTGTVSSNDVLRIRSGAGTSYAIVGFLNPGQSVTVTEQKTVGATVWGKTEKGWVSMDYIKLSGSNGSQSGSDNSAAASKTVTVTCSCLCIRSGAGTGYGISGYLYKGSKVTVTEEKTVDGTLWGKTSQGWICMEYTK